MGGAAVETGTTVRRWGFYGDRRYKVGGAPLVTVGGWGC